MTCHRYRHQSSLPAIQSRRNYPTLVRFHYFAVSQRGHPSRKQTIRHKVPLSNNPSFRVIGYSNILKNATDHINQKIIRRNLANTTSYFTTGAFVK